VALANVKASLGDHRLLDIQLIDAGPVDLDLTRLSATVATLRLTRLHGDIEIDADGGTNLQTWVAGLPDTAAPEEPDWRIAIPDLHLADADLRLTDTHRRAPVGLDVRVRSLSGRVSVDLSDAAPALELAEVNLRAPAVELSLADATAPDLALDDLSIEGLAMQWPAGSAEARLISVGMLRGQVLRDRIGAWPQVDALMGPVGESEDAASAAPSPLRWRVQAVKVGAIALDVRDDSLAPPTVFGLRGGAIDVGPIDSSRLDVPFSLAEVEPTRLAATFEDTVGGTLEVSGALTGSLAQGLDAVLDWQISDWSLAPFSSLVQSLTRLKPEGGVLLGSGALTLSSAADRPVFVATGSLAVNDMALRDAGDLPLVAWSSLKLESFDLEPSQQRIRHVRLDGGRAALVLNADRSTNFSGLFSSRFSSGDPSPDSSGEHVTRAGAELSSDAGPAQPSGLRIDRVSVRDAVVDLEDRGLVLPLNLRVQRLTGTVRGINADPRTRATVRLGGEVGPAGLASIEGQFAPFGTGGFSEFELSFRALDLLPLSPYFATFAGRRVDAGTLDLDLEYRVRGGRISGDSRAVIDNLALGERVASAGALDLPLDLAVAILTDANGRIEVDMPLTGRVDAPGFAYGRMLRQALRRVIVDTASAPFRSIARALGLSDAPRPVVRFPSGSANLLPSERDRLAALAETLAARPGLGLRVSEGVLPERDARALRRLAVRREHARRLGVELGPEDDPGPISFEDPDSQQTLAEMLAAREGAADADIIAQDIEAQLARDGAADSAQSAELYRAMYQHLVRELPLPDGALLALGAARSEAIAQALGEAGVGVARIQPVAVTALTPAKPAGVQVRLDPVPLRHSDLETPAASDSTGLDPPTLGDPDGVAR
jgi:hypothetical protein